MRNKPQIPLSLNNLLQALHPTSYTEGENLWLKTQRYCTGGVLGGRRCSWLCQQRDGDLRRLSPAGQLGVLCSPFPPYSSTEGLMQDKPRRSPGHLATSSGPRQSFPTQRAATADTARRGATK